MKKDGEFHDFIMGDVLGHIPGISSRAMFGGWGIYKEGRIFAIIADAGLYFKVGENNKKEYEVSGSHPFTYQGKDGRPMKMNYWELPEEVMNDRERIFDWVEASLSVETKKKK